MKRILLFGATNIAVLVVMSVVMAVFGLDGYLTANGLDYKSLLIFSAIFGFTGSLISLAISKWSALRSTGAQVIEQPANETERWLKTTVERLARQAGIDTPDVAVYPSPEVNAFATGAKRNSALVAVSVGLLQTMSRDEVEGVLGHEIAHVANGDMITLTLIQGVVNTFVIFFSRIIGYAIDQVLFRGRGGHLGFFMASLIAQVLLGFLATFIVAWFSRAREFRADAGGAELAGRNKMVAALNRLEKMQQPADLPEGLSAFGISGGRMGVLSRLRSTHPPLGDRIAALQRIS